MTSNSAARLNLSTIISIALPAFGLQSIVHEVLGHSVTAWLTGAKVVLISSTAMQTQGGERLIPGSGPLLNLMFGAAAYVVFRRIPRFTSARLFLWLFTFANLFLATGYILYSGLLNFGDSAAVIAGLHPAWLYRLALIAFGVWGYRYCVVLAADDLVELLRKGSLVPGDLPRILYPCCAAGSLLYLVASLFNPIGPSLILYDGVSEAAGVVVGFLLIAGIVPNLPRNLPVASWSQPSRPDSISFSTAWVVFASIFTVVFLVFMGRGIRLL